MDDHHEQEPPPFRLISRWNQVLRSDSFHIGQSSTCQLNNVILSRRGVSPMNSCFDASQQQINQIRRFYSIPQTPNSVIILDRLELDKIFVIIQLKNWKKCLTRFFCIFSDFKEDCL
ncbi:MAG: hypothetical protein KZQ71_09160, partial [Candidatus Thiodiazotropha sp. (ex Lucinoma aequizonata)]|nr:hypothetical protein [Candidatus Thiodiazotropha sp. (ex Lucinoma aequizonata)]